MTSEEIKNWYKDKDLNSGYYDIHQIESSNLYLSIDINNNKGFFLENIPFFKKILNVEYEYLDIFHRNKINSIKKNKLLKNCIFFNPNFKYIDFNTFIDEISAFIKNNIDNDTQIDPKLLIEHLKKINDLSKKNYKRINEIIGIWGELYFIKDLLLNTDSNLSKTSIINSWQSNNSNTLHDFIFKSSKIVIEVKTSIKDNRLHHFFTYDQVQNIKDHECYVLSTLINKDKNGISNYQLLKKIKSLIDDNQKKIFDKKIDIKNNKNLINDKNNFFKINDKFPSKYFLFDSVPKPKVNKEIRKVSWDSFLNDNLAINNKEQLNLRERMVS